jgi:hypothetical protein
MQAAVLKFRQVLNFKFALADCAVLVKFNGAAQSLRARDDLILRLQLRASFGGIKFSDQIAI